MLLAGTVYYAHIIMSYIHQSPLLILPLLDENINLAESKWEDIHVATGALKMFFRELPEPLFNYAYFSDFFNAISK